MSHLVDIPLVDVIPDRAAVLRTQGVVQGAEAPARLVKLADEALAILLEQGRVRAIWQPIDAESFATIYEGQGDNASERPIAGVAEHGRRLALFAATLGDPVCATIRRLFAAHDFALASFLDGAASEATERSSTWLEWHLAADADFGHDPAHLVQAYSPGFCGWHLTAQRALFATLVPERIGIRLNESCLMKPVKSISGVLVDGPPEIHRIDAKYGFCRDCQSKSCTARNRSLRVARGDRHDTA